jgi:hypothetical protein
MKVINKAISIAQLIIDFISKRYSEHIFFGFIAEQLKDHFL